MPGWPEFRLRALLRRLDAAGVEFVVVGGVAAVAHGSPQITQDLERLSRALQDLNATLRGMVVRIAGLDDLIAMKRAAGRPKDRIYVEELEAIKRRRAG